MLGGHVVRLSGIGRDVMEFPALGPIRHVDEAPPPLADAAVAKLTRGHLAPLPATLVRDERPVGPHGAGIAEERHEAPAFHVRGNVRRDGHAGEFAERRQHVDVRGHGRHVDALGQRALPPPERRHPRAPAPDGVLGPTHAGVEHAGPGGRAVVGREHNQCLPGDTEPINRLEQPADIRVDVLDHAVEPGDPVPLPVVAHPCRCEWRGVRLRRALRAVERLVRCVGRDQAEERLLVFRAAADPRDCLVEEHVGAVARRLDERAVAADHRIDIPVALDVAAAAGKRLADAPSAVDERAVEAAAPRLVGIFITKVPLAEDAGRVACPPQEIGQRRGREGQPFPLEDRVRDPRAELMPAGEQRRPRGRAGGAGMKLGQPHALPPEPVEVGRLDHWVQVRGNISIALVVGHHVDDVRRRLAAPRGGGLVRRRPGRGQPPAVSGDPVPDCLEVRHVSRLCRRQVLGLTAVGGEVVEFPRPLLRRHEFQIANANGAVPLVAPPERVVRRRRGRIGQRANKAPALPRRHGTAFHLLRRNHAGHVEHRGHDIDHVHRLVAKVASSGEASRPVDDPGRGDAPLVDPGLVATKGCVGTARPARAEAEKGLP